VVGALAAHTERAAWLTGWIAVYALVTVGAGLLLHRHASRPTSPAS
jgi:hypothetical protein